MAGSGRPRTGRRTAACTAAAGRLPHACSSSRTLYRSEVAACGRRKRGEKEVEERERERRYYCGCFVARGSRVSGFFRAGRRFKVFNFAYLLLLSPAVKRRLSWSRTKFTFVSRKR